MDKFLRLLYVCLVLAVTSACASSGGGSGDERARFFEKYDSNADGKIDRKEHQQAGGEGSEFDYHDENGDGLITWGEFGVPR
jgi:hypothetical protein